MRYEMFNYPCTLIESTNGIELVDLMGAVITELPNTIDQYKDESGMIDEDAIIYEFGLKIEIKQIVLKY